MSRLSVSSTALNGAAPLIRDYGADPDLLAQLAGLGPITLDRVEARVTLGALLRFLNMAAIACDEPQFGIELALRQGLEVLGPIWVLARHAETVGDSLESICRSLDLHSSALSLSLHDRDDGALLDYDIQTDDPGDEIGSAKQAVEQSLALLCKEIRALAGASWQPRYVQFRHQAPAVLKKHHSVFGQHVYFNQDRNALFIDRQTLDLGISGRSAHGHRVIRQHLQQKRQVLGESFDIRVAQVVRNLLISEGCSAGRVARSLGLNLRTLQHRLHRTGHSYQNILNDARVELGKTYLRDSQLSINEIAELLHFSEGSAFSRFFRERVGVSASEYQRRQQDAGEAKLK